MSQARIFGSVRNRGRVRRASDLIGVGGGDSYVASAVNFDGTNDWLTRGAVLTGLTDGKEGTFSGYFRMQGGDGANQTIIQLSASNNFRILRTTGNTIQIQGQNASGSNILILVSASSDFTVSRGWFHFLASWNLATAAAHVLIDAAPNLAGGPTITNDNINYDGANFVVGATNDAGSTGRWNGDMADVLFHPTYIDLTDNANVERFIEGGKPVFPGFDGERPLGVRPILFLAGHVDRWHTNRGTGGGLTENGALTAATSSPSD